VRAVTSIASCLGRGDRRWVSRRNELESRRVCGKAGEECAAAEGEQPRGEELTQRGAESHRIGEIRQVVHHSKAAAKILRATRLDNVGS
jgi:hypothetical protein